LGNESQKSKRADHFEDDEPSLIDNLWIPVFEFEAGQMSMKAVTVWFEKLVETGYIWKLPSRYVENAMELFDHGYLGSPTRELDA